MRYYSYLFVTSLYILVNVVVGLTDEPNNDTVFIPTSEWQTVKKGTPIPKGLHVRHNFQTGITEAKLMENESAESVNNESPKSVALHPDANRPELSESGGAKFELNDKNASISASELRAKLKNMKSSNKHKKLRTIEQIKNEFNNMNSGESTDFEFLDTFVNQFHTHRDAITSGSLSSEEIKVVIDILGQLEYLVHDIDNGLEFAQSGGLLKVIYPCLNGTVDEIKVEALRVLGAMVQSNPKVKEAALELELIQRILYTLGKYPNKKLTDRCLYALGSLVRNYPAGQKIFLSHGGLEIFSQLLEKGPISAQKRVMNLINDLVVERQELNNSQDSQDRDSEIQEYTGTELEDKIVHHKLCTNLGSLLIKTTQYEISTDSDSVDSDLLETIYQCTFAVGNICIDEFQQKKNEILPALNDITVFYGNFKSQKNSDDNDHQVNMLTLVKKIKDIIMEKSHDEL